MTNRKKRKRALAICLVVTFSLLVFWLPKREFLRANPVTEEATSHNQSVRTNSQTMAEAKKDRQTSGEVTYSIPKVEGSRLPLEQQDLPSVKAKDKSLLKAAAPRATFNGDQYVTSNKLMRKDTQIVNGSEMEFNTQYDLTYNWALPDNTFHQEDVLIFTIPKEFIVVDQLDFKVYSPEGHLVGLASVEGDDVMGYRIELTFTTDYVDQHSNVKGSFYFSTMLNDRYVNKGDSTLLPIPGGDITITVPEGGGSGGTGGAGNATADEKKGQQDIYQGTKKIRWQIILGRDTILKGKDLSDLESVIVEDQPDKQRLVPYDNNETGNSFAWEVTSYVSDLAYTSNYISKNQLGVAADNRSFSHEILPYLLAQEEYAVNEGTHFRTYELNYFTVPLDDTYSQNLKNNASIKVRYKDKDGNPGTDEWVLTDTVKWTVGGGEAEGDKGTVKIVKTDTDTASPLSGATFDLYKVGSPAPIVTDMKTNPNGELTHTGLTSGDYYFIETAAPTGYDLPLAPHNRFDFSLSGEDITKETTVEVPIKNKKLDRKFNLKKVDEENNQSLSGAEFTLEKQTNESWQKANETTYTTSEKGELSLGEKEIALLGNGTYRFKEMKAPMNYEMPDNPYTDSFEITTTEVRPETVTKKNHQLNHRITLEKEGEKASGLLANTEFIIQGQKSTNSWEQYGNKIFRTNAQGKLIIDNTTDPDLLATMIKDYPTPYKSFRFRETKAPTGGYQDPQYKPGSEAPGSPGDQFSVVIDMETLKKSDKSLDLTYSLENKLVRYDAQLSKVDGLGEPLKGAEFSIWEKNSSDKQVITGTDQGIFHFKDLVIGVTYIIKETKAPEGYGLQAYEYIINLDINGNLTVLRDDTEGEAIILVAGKDYDWDGQSLQLSFNVVNKKIHDIPVTGGMGTYLYILIGTVLIGTGYNIKTKKRGSL